MKSQTHSIKTIYLAAIVGILLILGIVGSLFILRSGSDHCIARIYQHGELIETIDLDQVTETYTFDIEGTDGACNTVEVRPGEIAIIAATCPDKVCVNVGFIKNDKLPITCMPNQVVIQLEHPDQANADIDGISH